jgi:hypothetical protein
MAPDHGLVTLRWPGLENSRSVVRRQMGALRDGHVAAIVDRGGAVSDRAYKAAMDAARHGGSGA